MASSVTPLTGNVALAQFFISTDDVPTYAQVVNLVTLSAPEGSTDATEMTNTDITDNHRTYDYGWTDGGEGSAEFLAREDTYTQLLATQESNTLDIKIEWTDPEHSTTDPLLTFRAVMTGHPTYQMDTEGRWLINIGFKVDGAPTFTEGT